MTDGCAGPAFLRQLHLTRNSGGNLQISPARRKTTVSHSSLLPQHVQVKLGRYLTAHLHIYPWSCSVAHFSNCTFRSSSLPKTSTYRAQFSYLLFPTRAKFKPAPSNVDFRPSWLSDTDTSPPTNDSKLSYATVAFQ